MAKFIGIDLGTTFSAAASIDEDGKPEILRDSEGNNIIPSCVYIDDGNVEVGHHAWELYSNNPSSGATRFKRLMGNPSEKININGSNFTPTELSTFVLKKILKEVEAVSGKVTEAVVTIPANFAHEAREATMLAAKKAGLHIKNIINEPTAAALYYAFKTGAELDGIYAVFDLGGGTFDISIIQAHGKNVEVLASDGVSRLGGDDFDSAIREIILEKTELKESLISLQLLEKIKKHLTQKEISKQVIDGTSFEVTRDEFNKKISTMLSQLEMMCESALEDANIEASQLKGVFLAGGSTRVPAVKKLVKDVFHIEPTTTANVDEVVALGAAVYCAYRTKRENLSVKQKESIEKVVIKESTNKCFGTISFSHNESRGEEEIQNSTIIPRGSSIPCSVTKSFYTVMDNQVTVDCKVTESTNIETDPKFVKVIWQGELALPEGRAAGQKIDVTFSYDDNQIMKCSFVDSSTGKDITVDLSMISNEKYDEDKIDKFLVE